MHGTVFFEEVDWTALHCCHDHSSLAPDERPSMAEAIRLLARMDGHLGRRGDGPPGTQEFGRGLQPPDVTVQRSITFTGAPPPRIWRSYPEGYRSRAEGP